MLALKKEKRMIFDEIKQEGYSSKKKGKKIRGWLINGVLMCIILVSLLVFLSRVGEGVRNSQILLNDNWKVSVNGKMLDETSLSKMSFPVTDMGDHVELNTTLPDDTITRPVLELWIYHSVVNVFVDGKNIYSYGEDLHAQNKMVGNGVHWISLPEDYIGKQIKISYDVTEDDAFTSFRPMHIKAAQNVAKNFILDNLLEIVVSVFLIGCGVMLAIIAIFFSGGNKEYVILFYAALFCICIATWMLCNCCVFQLITDNRHLIAYFEYLSLYLAPIPLLLFIYHLQDGARIRKSLICMVVLLVVFNLLVVILNYFNIHHLSKLLMVYHILGFCSVFIVFIANTIAWKQRKRKSDRMMLCGLVVMLFFVFEEIVRFNIDKYVKIESVDLSKSLLPIGVLIFVFTLVASYIYRLVHMFYESVERKTLMQMAYTDGLTAVANRTKCEEEFKEREDKKKDTTIINFDLNHFKQVNDTYGHKCGDELLIEFAQLLTGVFGGDGLVGRMGGDEFVVILDRTDNSFIDKRLEELNGEIAKINDSEIHPYKISVAYGYSTTKENIGESLVKIYQKSDEKMYINKAKSKSG